MIIDHIMITGHNYHGLYDQGCYFWASLYKLGTYKYNNCSRLSTKEISKLSTNSNTLQNRSTTSTLKLNYNLKNLTKLQKNIALAAGSQGCQL